jgi:hypothetical protein
MDHVARIVSGRLSHKADMLKAYLDVRQRFDDLLRTWG